MHEQGALKQESGPGHEQGRSRPDPSHVGSQRRPTVPAPVRHVPDLSCGRADPFGVLKPWSAGSSFHRRGACWARGGYIPTLSRRGQAQGCAARCPGKREAREMGDAEASGQGYPCQGCAWGGIARVNQEVLLTVLDVHQRHESKHEGPLNAHSSAAFRNRPAC